MITADSTPSRPNSKPSKPYPEYPLFPHDTGRWAKKIRGKLHYFGPWAEPEKALEKFIAEFPELSVSILSSAPLPAVKAKPKHPRPYDGFPLFPHDTGRWAKKIRGKLYYFGTLEDWEGALAKYNYEIPFLSQGVTPPPPERELLVTVGEMCNLYLADCDARVQTGELTQRSFQDYKRVSKLMIDEFGEDYPVEHLNKEQLGSLRERMARKYSLLSLGNEIARCRVIFNFAYRDGLIATPVRVGTSFARPSAKSIRIAKAGQPPKIFTIEELTALYVKASPTMRCFMLLALNGGMGNADIGQLQHRHIVNGWVIYPRPKTGVDRRFPLWAETLAAIEATKVDPSESELVFVTRWGHSWYKGDTGVVDCPIAKEFRKLCLACSCHQKRRGFYSLRHQFRTVADAAHDRVAIDGMMGHADTTMGGMYREWVDPARLVRVAEHVRSWVLPMLQSV